MRDDFFPDKQIYMAKKKVAFRKFANAPTECSMCVENLYERGVENLLWFLNNLFYKRRKLVA